MAADAALITELSTDPGGIYSGCTTAEEYWAAYVAATIPEVYQRFISLRACAAILTDTEYATFRAMLTSAATSSVRVADMVDMLAQPCADSGDSGGLDFGCDGVREMIDSFGAVEGMATAAAALKALAERTVSRQSQLGQSWRLLDFIRAVREMQQ